MWPEGSPWTWWGIAAALAILGLAGPPVYDNILVPWWQSGSPQVALRWIRKRALPLGTTILIGWVVVDNWDSIASWPGRTLSRVISTLPSLPSGPNYDHLRTRPICEADCANLGFRIRECEIESVEAGGLAVVRRRRERRISGDPKAATEYFRGCMIDRGLSWEPCEQGEMECRLLRTFDVFSRYTIPSFID